MPVGNDPYSGIYNATNFGLACTQQKVQPEFPENLSDEAKAAVNAYLESINFNGGEDCKFAALYGLVGFVLNDIVSDRFNYKCLETIECYERRRIASFGCK